MATCMLETYSAPHTLSYTTTTSVFMALLHVKNLGEPVPPLEFFLHF